MSRSRIATDVALARMTACEAAGETVAIDYLIAAAVETRQLSTSDEVDRRRLTRLLERFSTLARELTTPPGSESRATVCPAAPARLLSAVAWGRACNRVASDGPAAAQVLVDLLKGIARSRLGAVPRYPVPLYEVLGRLPRGQQRVAVYTDLLDLLPRHFEIALADQVAVPDRGGHREGAGGRRGTGDDAIGRVDRQAGRQPGGGEGVRGSAAGGGEGEAGGGADRTGLVARSDGGVVERTDRTRVELLSLAGVPV